MTETPDPAERQEILTAVARMMSGAVPLEERPATSQLPDAVSGSAPGRPDLDAIRSRVSAVAHITQPWYVHWDTDDDHNWLVAYPTDCPAAGMIARVPDYGADIAHLIADAPTDLAALLAEVDRLRAAMAAQCDCAPGSPDCDGPQVDCPIHGAVHELHEARAENKRLREERNAARLDARQAHNQAIDYAHARNEEKRALEVELNDARRERDQARARVRAVEETRVWTNEDGKDFLFADDIRQALEAQAPAATCGATWTPHDRTYTCARPPDHKFAHSAADDAARWLDLDAHDDTEALDSTRTNATR